VSKTLGTRVVAMATSEACEPPSRGGRWNCARWAAGPGLVVGGPSGCGDLPLAQGNRAVSRLLRRPRRLFARAVPAAQTGPRRERSLSTPRACYRRRRLFVIEEWITCTTSMIIRTSWVCSADFISTRCGRRPRPPGSTPSQRTLA
jgi:hypothetical protein